MITITINIEDRENYTDEEGEEVIATEAALAAAVSQLEYEDFIIIDYAVVCDAPSNVAEE
jgi:hypothetical protein